MDPVHLPFFLSRHAFTPLLSLPFHLHLLQLQQPLQSPRFLPPPRDHSVQAKREEVIRSFFRLFGGAEEIKVLQM